MIYMLGGASGASFLLFLYAKRDIIHIVVVYTSHIVA